MKYIEASPELIRKSLTKPSNYLIEKVKKDRYILHREIEEEEMNNYNRKQIIKYKGKTFEKRIGEYPTEWKAYDAIHLYWDDVNKKA